MSADTQTPKLSLADIDNATEDPRWLGWGYLGERGRENINSRKVHTADAAVLVFANREGWTYEHLFEWCNSKPGRHFGDLAFGSGHRWNIKWLEEEGRRTGTLIEVLPGT